MKNIVLLLAIGASLGLAGCNNVSQDEHDALQAKHDAIAKKLDNRNSDVKELEFKVSSMEDAQNTSNDELNELRSKLATLENVPAAEPDTSALDAEIVTLKARIKELEEAPKKPVVTDGPEPGSENPETVPVPTELSEEDKARIDDLIPTMNTDAAGTEQRNELRELLARADKETRTKAVKTLKELVAKEPENQYARLALAELMTTQFQDVGGGIAAGRLATDIKKEIKKATEIDPEYYDAQHFLALFNVGYPTFMPDFQNANVQLDKCIELQADMTWEERFADVYAAYGQWYQKQQMYDEGLQKVQEGLDKSPRNEGLLARKTSIETAKNGEG
ncbi:MAG: hypothetical protein ACYTDT_02970 [Planctomycetota bacterium]|jgi:tetratricopeptide (TPR) repeat protein